jgi:hypothetical protein
MPFVSQGLSPQVVYGRQRTAGMKLPSRLLAIAGVVSVMAGCTSGESMRDESGRVISPGDWSVFDLRPGDCFAPLPDAAGDVGTVPLVPCELPHTTEVFAVARHPDSEYPGLEAIATYADLTCLTALETEFGLSVSDAVAFSYLLPTAEGWASDGDRSVVCVVISGEDNLKVGSLVEGTKDL